MYSLQEELENVLEIFSPAIMLAYQLKQFRIPPLYIG